MREILKNKYSTINSWVLPAISIHPSNKLTVDNNAVNKILLFRFTILSYRHHNFSCHSSYNLSDKSFSGYPTFYCAQDTLSWKRIVVNQIISWVLLKLTVDAVKSANFFWLLHLRHIFEVKSENIKSGTFYKTGSSKRGDLGIVLNTLMFSTFCIVDNGKIMVLFPVFPHRGYRFGGVDEKREITQV